MSYRNQGHDQEDDPDKKIKNLFLARQEHDMHKVFFNKNDKLEYIKADVINENRQKARPFRNKSCKDHECVYDLEDLVQKYKNSGSSMNYEFFCEFCNELISLKDFYHDSTLAEGIDGVWQKYNTDNVNVREIRQVADGSVQLITGVTVGGPLLTAKNPKSTAIKANNQNQSRPNSKGSNQGETGKQNNKVFNFGGEHDDHHHNLLHHQLHYKQHGSNEEEGSFYYTSIPRLGDFNKEDFADLTHKFSKVTDDRRKVATPFEIPINKQEFDNILHSYGMAPSVMSFFVRYIKNYNKLFQPTKDQEEYLLPFIVENFDKYNKIVSFRYLKGFENKFKSQLGLFHEYFKKLIAIFRYDERWILAIFDMKKTKCIIVDFLVSDLSRASKDEIYTMIKSYLKQEFDVQPSSFTVYDKQKVQTYDDCGLFVCKYLVNFYINSMDPDQISVGEAEKNSLKKVLPWLLLKIHFNQEENPAIKMNNPVLGGGNINDHHHPQQQSHHPQNQGPLKRRLTLFGQQQSGETPLKTVQRRPTLKLNVSDNQPRGSHNEILPASTFSKNKMSSMKTRPQESQLLGKQSIELGPGPLLSPDNQSKFKHAISEINDKKSLTNHDVLSLAKQKSFAKESLGDNVRKKSILGPQQGQNFADIVKLAIENKDQIRNIKESQTHPDKVKMTKQELTEMLEQLKKDIVHEVNENDELSVALEEEGLFINSDQDQEQLTKEDVKRLIKRFQTLQPDQSDPFNRPRAKLNDKPKLISYNDYMTKYQEIADELQGQVEDALLGQFNMLHIKYPQKRSHLEPIPELVNPLRKMGDFRSNISTPLHNNNVNLLHKSEFNQKSELNLPLMTPKKLPPLSPQASKMRHNNSFNAGVLSNQQQTPNESRRQTPQALANSVDLNRLKAQSVSKQLLKEGKQYGFNAPGFNQTIENPQQKSIIAKRYGIEVEREAFQIFKNSHKISNKLVSFYLSYLKEKQDYQPVEYLSKFRLRIFYFNPDFYNLLTDHQPLGLKVYYGNVKEWTKNQSSFGRSIFDFYDKVVFVIKVKEGYWALAYIDNDDKRAILFDTRKSKEKSPINNPILYNISQYMNFESQDKANTTVNLTKWQFSYGDIMKSDDPDMSALIILKLIHNISKGTLNSYFAESELKQFQKQILDTFLRIGITSNNKGELGNIEKFPI